MAGSNTEGRQAGKGGGTGGGRQAETCRNVLQQAQAGWRQVVLLMARYLNVESRKFGGGSVLCSRNAGSLVQNGEWQVVCVQAGWGSRNAEGGRWWQGRTNCRWWGGGMVVKRQAGR